MGCLLESFHDLLHLTRRRRSKTATTLGSIIFFATFFPYYYVGGDSESSVTAKTWSCLLAPTCLALSSDTFAAYEGGVLILKLIIYVVMQHKFMGIFASVLLCFKLW